MCAGPNLSETDHLWNKGASDSEEQNRTRTNQGLKTEVLLSNSQTVGSKPPKFWSGLWIGFRNGNIDRDRGWYENTENGGEIHLSFRWLLWKI